ncbi:MAG: hypothetical protein COB78_05790 [Hyphomicrobiales bacterium]|nr:MAG: hypothetical protein COB78_05790 [Hyphomicrobiales bacterium]
MSLMGEQLLKRLGPDGYLQLLENYGGIRLFVPKSVERSELTTAIGFENVRLLSERHGAEYIKVPLDREYRAKIYRAQGLSHARIARRLGVTENAVEKLFIRDRRRNENQIDMFDTEPAALPAKAGMNMDKRKA